MHYMLLMYGDERMVDTMSESQIKHTVAGFRDFCAALRGADVLRGSGQLAPVRAATTVRVASARAHLSDGPVQAGAEQLGGFYLIEVADLDAALAWAARCPAAFSGAVEVRPLA